MPYAAGVYTVPPGTAATTLTPVDSSDYNAFVDDIEAAQNAARPVAAGGTGAQTVITAWDALAKKGTDIATAASINLTTATGPSLSLTGTTTITGVTLAEGSIRVVRAAAAFQITASANLLCNGSSSVNMSVAAEDTLIFRGGAGGVVTVSRIGGASTLPDQDRRNALLNTCSIAALAAGYQRRLKTFADGYKASDGVNSGSSSNYTVNTTSGYVAPSPAITTVFLTSGTSWSVPSGVTNLLTVETIGGGGGGGGGTGGSRGGGGGGGGGYSAIANLAVTPLASIAYAIGGAGTAGSAAGAGGNGGDTYFNGASFGASSVGAKGGTGGGAAGTTTYAGGAAGSGVGTTKRSGGAGGGTGSGFVTGGGGGGAAGPSADGAAGGTASSSSQGGGGGGANGGGAGGATGAGGTGPTGTAGGSVGSPGGSGSNGSGGGGSNGSGVGGAGGAGQEWDSTHGSGGGGGGAFAYTAAAGAGGAYGGGGGGGGAGSAGQNGTGGAGVAGLIVITYSTSVNNMTVVTTSQTADASVSNGRVLLEYNPVDSITLNTDLTVDVTCDGGSHWASATLTSIGLGQSGRTVAETADVACTAGTSFAARIKTANNKNVQIYKAALVVH